LRGAIARQRSCRRRRGHHDRDRGERTERADPERRSGRGEAEEHQQQRRRSTQCGP
jgi:hypothetical protein